MQDGRKAQWKSRGHGVWRSWAKKLRHMAVEPKSFQLQKVQVTTAQGISSSWFWKSLAISCNHTSYMWSKDHALESNTICKTGYVSRNWEQWQGNIACNSKCQKMICDTVTPWHPRNMGWNIWSLGVQPYPASGSKGGGSPFDSFFCLLLKFSSKPAVSALQTILEPSWMCIPIHKRFISPVLALTKFSWGLMGIPNIMARP